MTLRQAIRHVGNFSRFVRPKPVQVLVNNSKTTPPETKKSIEVAPVPVAPSPVLKGNTATNTAKVTPVGDAIRMSLQKKSRKGPIVDRVVKKIYFDTKEGLENLGEKGSAKVEKRPTKALPENAKLII